MIQHSNSVCRDLGETKLLNSIAVQNGVLLCKTLNQLHFFSVAKNKRIKVAIVHINFKAHRFSVKLI